MTDVIFARTRYHYQSYTDWHELIRLSGFPLIYADEINPDSDNIYIYGPDNGETLPGWPGARARIIHWQLEWSLEAPLREGVRERWVGDNWYADQIHARYVPAGSHPNLNLRPDERLPRAYDVAWMAYTPPRRGQILTDLNERGLRVAPNAWGEERHVTLLQSACMVHVHQWPEFPCLPPLRLALCAAYRLPLLCEMVYDDAPFAPWHLLKYRYGDLADYAARMTRHSPPEVLAEYGEALYQYLCVDNPFRKRVEGAL